LFGLDIEETGNSNKKIRQVTTRSEGNDEKNAGHMTERSDNIGSVNNDPSSLPM